MAKKKEYIMSLKREKTIRILAIMALIVAILSVSISYAAMSKNVQIIKLMNEDGISDTSDSDSSNNSIDDNSDKKITRRNPISDVKKNKSSSIDAGKNFDVGFYNLKKEYVSPGVVINSEPKITNIDKKIEDFDITFNVPGQYVLYTVDIKNKEISDGVITALNKYVSVCDENKERTTDEILVCKGIKIDLFYSLNNINLENGDTLNAGESKNVTIKISYDTNKSVSNTVNISDFHYSIVYSENK